MYIGRSKEEKRKTKKEKEENRKIVKGKKLISITGPGNPSQSSFT
jgi:hypothetical protein